MPTRNLAAALGLAAALAGCGGPTLEHHAGQAPRLDLRDYLDGPLTASGMFFDHAGRPSLAFTVDMEGSWQGDTGTLAERFTYSDGTTDTRTWTIRFADANSFRATAHDVVGAASGEQRGNAARITYRLRVPRGEGETVVSMEDWLYLMQDGTLINRTKMRKFGLPVGELVVAFRKGET